MSKYEGVDFYNLDQHLTEEELMVRDLVRDWVDEEVLPIIEDYYTKGTFPLELIPKIGEMGLFGCNLAGYECAGLSNVAYGVICQELERGDSAIRSCVSVQGSLTMYPIHAFGTEEQKNKYLPGMAKGELIGCFGLTEPDHGSDPAGMETKAVEDGDSYVLNGAKMWITNGTIADLAIVWAKLDGKIRGFIVEKGDKGFTAPEMKGKHSLRASITSELVFQDCRIPKDRLLPDVQGLKGPLSCLNQARFGIAWGSLGAAMGCFHSSVDYAKSRIMFKKPIASFQLVQNKLAWMLREITKGQLLAYHLGRAKDKGEATPEMISLGKMNNVDIALQIARNSRDIHGANGILNEYPIMRHMANLESVYTYEGTHDIHNLILGRWITGLQAFE
ncbi:MAG: acyl-CoA dehydrogenase [Chloroflexi bacterium]|jgi:glutaryl-CoA dehydrogenase|nr:acyl-CoA dehydrogenase [Chloroflexota bacterium]MDC0243268.1 acyl-CoA dehydrogenase family protein [Marine Group III euryarchaeote]|tara:strand:+ start:2067 stop:3233 length:1167 start_codon:yes stop_codon:yes gene_type:complete